MGDPYISEIRLFSFAFAPKGWSLCNGQILPINQNQALFALIGSTYGGDGTATFALPNLQGTVPIGASDTYPLGKAGGENLHVLTTNEIPAHTHTISANPSAVDGTNLFASDFLSASPANIYASNAPANQLTSLVQGTISNAGLSEGHQNMMPSLSLTFCIALQGLYPSPT